MDEEQRVTEFSSYQKYSRSDLPVYWFVKNSLALLWQLWVSESKKKKLFQLLGGELLGNIKEGLVEGCFLWYAVKLAVLESRSGGCGKAMNMVGEIKECYFNKYCVYACWLIQKIALFVRTAFGEANFDQKKKKEIVCPFAAVLNIAV